MADIYSKAADIGWLDRQTILTLGPVAISGGWVSFASILVRFVLTVAATLALVAGTGIHGVCRGLELLGMHL